MTESTLHYQQQVELLKETREKALSQLDSDITEFEDILEKKSKSFIHDLRDYVDKCLIPSEETMLEALQSDVDTFDSLTTKLGAIEGIFHGFILNNSVIFCNKNENQVAEQPTKSSISATDDANNTSFPMSSSPDPGNSVRTTEPEKNFPVKQLNSIPIDSGVMKENERPNGGLKMFEGQGSANKKRKSDQDVAINKFDEITKCYNNNSY